MSGAAPTETRPSPTLLIRNARLLTLAAGPRPRRGGALGDLSIVPKGSVLVSGPQIAEVVRGPGRPSFTGRIDREVDARGRVLMPGFVDCHTHACWAGNRLDEWEQKLQGADYLSILAAGGGIMSTVRAVRAASQQDLQDRLLDRLGEFLHGGTTTVEVKSGYGLTTVDELKMLRAIRDAGAAWRAAGGGTVVPTALLGHALDPEQPDQIARTMRETLPALRPEFAQAAVDAFCEKSAWSLNDTVSLLTAAKAAAHPVRVHADQFTSMGMIAEAIRLEAHSVDHLEASTRADLGLLARSDTFGVALPICGLHLDGRYADARAFVDMGGALAIATNCNPGSAPSTSMPLAIAAAVRHCGLSPSEAISAAIVNPVTLLGLHDRGVMAPGMRADLILLHHTDERLLAYELGGNPVDFVVCGGNLVPAAPT